MGLTVSTERIVGGRPTTGSNGLSKTELEMICNLLDIEETVAAKLPIGEGCTYKLVLMTVEGIPAKIKSPKKKSAKKARKKK